MIICTSRPDEDLYKEIYYIIKELKRKNDKDNSKEEWEIRSQAPKNYKEIDIEFSEDEL